MTPQEKLTLQMLCEIYEKLGLDELDPRLIHKAVTDDALWVVDWKYSGLELGGEIPEKGRFVLDVLDLFHFLSESWKQLPAEGRAQVEAVRPHAASEVNFKGFDGNNECEYMTLTSYLVVDLKRYRTMLDDEQATMNSHMQMVPVYQRMLSAFLPIRESVAFSGGLLNAEQITEILLEQVHPSNR